jgi:hypothetical protein
MSLPRLLAASLALLAFGLAGCGGENPQYPDSARQSFLRECRVQIPPTATEEACGCVLEEIERTIPYADYRRAAAAFRNDRELESDTARKLQDAVNRCLAAS